MSIITPKFSRTVTLSPPKSAHTPSTTSQPSSKPSPSPSPSPSTADALSLLRALDEIMPIANRLHLQGKTESGHVFYWNVDTQQSTWTAPDGFEDLDSLASKLAARFNISERVSSNSTSLPSSKEESKSETQPSPRNDSKLATTSAPSTPAEVPGVPASIDSDASAPITIPQSSAIASDTSVNSTSHSRNPSSSPAISAAIPASTSESETERRRRVSVANAFLGAGDALAALEASRALAAMGDAMMEAEDEASQDSSIDEGDVEASVSASQSASTSSLPADPTTLTFTESDSTKNVELDAQNVPKSATFAKLVEHLTSPQADAKLALDLLLTYRSFCAPKDLVLALIARIRTAQGGTASVVQLRAINVLRLWVDQHWNDFARDKDVLASALRSFHADIQRVFPALLKPMDALMSKLDARLADAARDSALFLSAPSLSASLSTSPRRSTAIPAPLWSANSSRNLLESDPVLALFSIDPLELARQLTLIEYDLWCQVHASEFLDQAWTKESTKRERAPHIVSLIDHFNSLSGCVQCSLLRTPSAKERARLVVRWLEVLAHLRSLHNFNAMLELVSALNNSSVFRLKQTFALLGKKESALLAEFTSLVSSADNYKALRHALSQLQPPCLPYLGMYLTDLVFIEEGNKNMTRTGLINFQKRRLVAAVLREVQQYQQDSYALLPVPEIQATLRSATQRNISEKRRYELSLYLEPRPGTPASATSPPSELFESKELERVLKKGSVSSAGPSFSSANPPTGSPALNSSGSSKDPMKRLQSPTSPRRTMSAAPAVSPHVISAAQQRSSGISVEPNQQGGYVLSVNDASLLKSEEDDDDILGGSPSPERLDRRSRSPATSPRRSSNPSISIPGNTGAIGDKGVPNSRLTQRVTFNIDGDQPAAREELNTVSPKESPSASVGAGLWLPPLNYVAQHPPSQPLPKRLCRQLWTRGFCSEQEAQELTSQSLCELAARRELGAESNRSALFSARDSLVASLGALRDSIDEMENSYVRPLQVAWVLTEPQLTSVFGGVSDLALALATLLTLPDSSLTALITDFRSRLLPLLASYVSRFDQANAALAECAKSKGFMEWLATMRAMSSDSRSLREVRAAPLALTMPVLLALLGLARVCAAECSESLVSEAVASMVPLALDAYDTAQNVLFMSRFVEVARDSHGLPKKLIEEKMAQRNKTFFRRQTIFLESGKKAKAESCFAFLFSGFLLIFSDDKKFKFMEYIELGPLTKCTLDVSNGHRISFSANFNKHGQGVTMAMIVDEPEEWLADLQDAIPDVEEAGTAQTASPRVKRDKEKDESVKGRDSKEKKTTDKDGEKPGLASKDSKRLLKK